MYNQNSLRLLLLSSTLIIAGAVHAAVPPTLSCPLQGAAYANLGHYTKFSNTPPFSYYHSSEPGKIGDDCAIAFVVTKSDKLKDIRAVIENATLTKITKTADPRLKHTVQCDYGKHAAVYLWKQVNGQCVTPTSLYDFAKNHTYS